MVHHAAQVICAFSVGTDGLTWFRRLKRRKFGTPLAGFGERVWLREPPLEKVNKFNPRCVEARLLGVCLRSSRYIVFDADSSFPLRSDGQEGQPRGQMDDGVTKGPFLGR